MSLTYRSIFMQIKHIFILNGFARRLWPIFVHDPERRVTWKNTSFVIFIFHMMTWFILLRVVCYPDYNAVGCYKDTSSHAIQTLEGKDAILDGSYSSRTNPIAKCAVAAIRAGYSMFAVQDGGWCAASATASQTYDKYGKSTACKADGEGGPGANQVYFIEGKSSKSLQTIPDGSLCSTKSSFKFWLLFRSFFLDEHFLPRVTCLVT